MRACNALGIEELTGTIAAGRFADLVITYANPLDDIRTLSASSTVVVRGHVMDHPTVERFPALDALIDQL